MALYINGNKASGGGNSNMKELTQEEYDALTTEEKNNGTVYYITDVNGDGESFQPIIYSENEREVGVWVDGKPLYQKTFELTIPDGNGAYEHEFTEAAIPNLDKAVKTSYSLGIGERAYVPWYSQATVILDEQTATGVTFYFGSNNYVGRIIYYTVCYTKTTDTAGSGTWTPQGVPAVHYSIDEQVVGVDEEGNTLYEKFYKVANVYSTNTIIDSTKTPSNTKIKGLIFGSFTIGGAYNNAQFCTPHISTNSDVRLFMNENGLSINAEGFDTSTYPITDCYFRIQYTKSSQGGN